VSEKRTIQPCGLGSTAVERNLGISREFSRPPVSFFGARSNAPKDSAHVRNRRPQCCGFTAGAGLSALWLAFVAPM
jgi:hypothetical protein